MYLIILFLHFLGVIALFGGFIVFHRSMAALRRLNTVEQVLPWFGLLATSRPMIQGGLGLLVLTGFALGGMNWRGAYPWLVAALAGAIVVGGLAGGVAGVWMRRTKAMLDEGASGALAAPLAAQLRMPRPWVAIACANGLAFGVVWVMTTKPDWIGSFAVLIVAAAAGGWIGSSVAKRQ